MKATVYIRNNKTKEIRPYIDNRWAEPDEKSSGSYFGWTEGNYACDCNLDRFFWDGNSEQGNTVTDIEDFPCGNTEYTVLYADLETGERVDLNDLD